MLYKSGNGTPSGAIAKTAAALAILGGLTNLIGAIYLLIAVIGDLGRFDNALAIFTILGATLMAYALGYGGVLLWRQDETGRYIVTVASGVALAIGVVALAFSLLDYEFGLGVFWWTPADHPMYLSPALGLVGQITSLVQESLIRSLLDIALPLLTLLPAASRYSARWTMSRPAGAIRTTAGY
jgi:peptidoglycan biosynthesis protein MviN/MurJ (putative lipid II flippase)